MLNSEYIEIMAAALSQKTGVKIKPGQQWRADVKNNVLEYNAREIKNLDFDISKGLLLHELGHIKFTDDAGEQTELEKKYPEATHEIANALEDLRITRLLNDEYGEFSRIPLQNIDEYYTRINIAHAREFSQLPKLSQYLTLAMLDHESEQNHGIAGLVGYNAGQLRTDGPDNPLQLNADVIKRYNENCYKIEDDVSRAVYSGDVSEVKKIINESIAGPIMDFIEEFEKQAGDKKQQRQQATQKARDIIDAMQKGQTPQKLGQSLQHSKIIEKERAAFEYGPIARTLGHRLTDILEERRATHYAGNRPTGKLLSKNVFKIPLNDKNIFSRKLENLPDRYAFYFLIDASGSMAANNQAYNASIAAYILDIATKENKLPGYLIVFNDEARKIKEVREYYPGGGTYDGAAFEIAYNDFKNYPGYEKIVIVLTDGQTYKPPERAELITKIQKDRGIIIGIGIGRGISEEILQENYPAYINIQNPEELPGEFVKLLNRLITR